MFNELNVRHSERHRIQAKNGLTQAVADRAKRPDGQRRDLTALVLVQEWFGANSPGS